MSNKKLLYLRRTVDNWTAIIVGSMGAHTVVMRDGKSVCTCLAFTTNHHCSHEKFMNEIVNKILDIETSFNQDHSISDKIEGDNKNET